MYRIAVFLCLTGFPQLPSIAWAVDTHDTRFLHEPAVGKDRLVFVYADDLWTSRLDGSEVRRLTAHPGPESSPFLSPDGELVAFTGTYDGNADVYVIPIGGGEPTRLTWHPGDDVVQGFTPEGAVLFSSQRQVFTNRFAQFFTIGTKGGFPTRLPIPSGERAAYSPDGKFLAYTPLSEAFRQWKHYRGGRTSRIWILTLDGLSVEQVPQPESRCNDTYPMWVGDALYFLSDRDGEFNLYAYERSSKKIERLSLYDQFPIDTASAGAGKIVYEQAGRLYLFDTNSRQPERLKIGVAADLVETRPRFVDAKKFVRDSDLSPSGKRAVMEVRGEVITLPAKTGDPKNLTKTSAAHERSPIWSPDGKFIAYFSDASGEYALSIAPADGTGSAKSHRLNGSGFYERPLWSPDSKKIAYIDNSRTVYMIDVESGRSTTIDSEPIYGPINTLSYDWSPDSRWLAYTKTNRAYFQTIRLYSLETGKSTALTDGLAETGEPVFDATGKYLYFLGSTDAGPVKHWFDQSNTDNRASYSVFLAVLDKKTPNPLLKKNDEEGDEAEKKDEADKDKDKNKDKDEDKPNKDVKITTTVDLDDLDHRVVALPIASGSLSNLVAGPEGTLYFLKRTGRPEPGIGSLVKFDLKTREEETLAEKLDGFKLSGDRKHFLYQAKEVQGIVEAGKFDVGKGKLAVEAISIKIEPRAEWRQIAHEAWRINRDYFYDPKMHGADWSEIRSKYEPFLDEVPTRADLNRVIRWMLSELAVGHSNSGGGERVYEPKSVPIGLLGADYEVDQGKYKFKTIYGGLNWDTKLRAPLVAPGVDVKAGEYLLAVDGQDLNADTEIYRLFENTVGRRVELKVGPRSDGDGSRTVIVEPIAEEGTLRNREWVERNLRYVHKKTDNKVAYVYVPNTANLGHAYFKRYFFPQADKDAIIVDERFNGGGQVADYYIDLLRKQPVSWWATRYGDPIRTPGAAILGPKVMLIDETAGSGGDLLPWMFRKFKLGTLVGRRTWGGLVGMLGFPVLMDGGRVTAPDLGFYNEDGWRVENEGDVEGVGSFL